MSLSITYTCNKLLLQLSNINFSSLQKLEYQYKRMDNEVVVTKLRETRLTMTNNNASKKMYT